MRSGKVTDLRTSPRRNMPVTLKTTTDYKEKKYKEDLGRYVLPTESKGSLQGTVTYNVKKEGQKVFDSSWG